MRACMLGRALLVSALHAALQAMRNIQRWRVAAIALGALCMLALSTGLGQGAAPLSRAPLGLLGGALLLSAVAHAWQSFYDVSYRYRVGAGAAACLALWWAATLLLKRFSYLGHSHSEH